MEYGAIDLYVRRSQIRIINDEERVVLDRRIDTTREALTQLFGARRRWRSRAGGGSTGRSGMISLLRAVLRQEGLRLPSGSAARVLQRLDQLGVPAAVTAVLEPLRAVLRQLTTTLATADQTLTARATAEAVTQRLMTAPGVGPSWRSRSTG
jgi:hypothetical protein